MGESRKCPECNSLMEFRLGAYECVGCGHQLTKEQAQQTEQTGPGLKQPWQADAQPARAPTGGPSMYSLPEDDEPAGSRELTGLGIEKRVYFWIAAGLTALSVLGSLFGTISGNNSFGSLLSEVFWEAVHLSALAFVLFSSELWAKGCCAVLVILDLLALLGTAFVVLPLIFSLASGSSILPTFIAIPVWISLAINCAWSGWLLWILWRDYQGLNPS